MNFLSIQQQEEHEKLLRFYYFFQDIFKFVKKESNLKRFVKTNKKTGQIEVFFTGKYSDNEIIRLIFLYPTLHQKYGESNFIRHLSKRLNRSKGAIKAKVADLNQKFSFLIIPYENFLSFDEKFPEEWGKNNTPSKILLNNIFNQAIGEKQEKEDYLNRKRLELEEKYGSKTLL